MQGQNSFLMRIRPSLTKLTKVLVSALASLIAFSGAVEAEDIYYYHNDHLGTPQFMTDADQNLVWKAGQEPFGAEDPSVETIKNNLRFPGQYYDNETGLHYNWNRYYSPETGRYITSDPIGLQGGLNTYGYVDGNPARFADPSGLYLQGVLIGGGVRIIGGRAASAAVGAGLRKALGRQVGNVASCLLLLDCDGPDEDECEEDGDCEELYKQISRWRGIVKKRYAEMRLDKLDLYRNIPTGRMSWGGHQQQFIQAQGTLRSFLEEADQDRCFNYESDAWKWATMPPPSQPAPRI
jgi:RHS repeat-associated protein